MPTNTVILAQDGTRYLVSAGRGDALGAADVELVQVYDRVAGTLGDPVPLDSLMAHSPNWPPPSDPEAILDDVRAEISKLQ